MSRRALALLAVSLAPLIGCASPGTAAKEVRPDAPPVKLRFCLAQPQPLKGWRQDADPTGVVLFVAPDSDLTEDDVLSADALVGDRGSIIRIVLTPVGAHKLADLTRRNIGRRLAIFVDDKLACAPMIVSEIDSNEAYITADYRREEAERIATALSQHAKNPPTISAEGTARQPKR